MSTKRKVSLPPRSVDTGPKERAQHGAMVAESDPNVAGLVRVRALSVIEKMGKDGVLDEQQVGAGQRFWWYYREAKIGPHYAQSNLLRVDSSPDTEITMRTVRARTILREIAKLVGADNMAVLEHVVGEDESLEDTALYFRHKGMAWDHKHVRGLLHGVLTVLAGYERW